MKKYRQPPNNGDQVLYEQDSSLKVIKEYTYDDDGKPLTMTYKGDTYTDNNPIMKIDPDGNKPSGDKYCDLSISILDAKRQEDGLGNEEVLSGIQISNWDFLEIIQQQYVLSFPVDQTIFDKPSLIVVGRQDAVVGYKDALPLIDLYTRASFAVVDTAGHNLQIEQPNVLNELLKNWLLNFTD
ncbi:alpha/beta fold hydrolase [Bacillus sp. JJ722]|uniref:alpha/beta fold hydrolase n=1 Tax=Bacillus sp. JJ722 TaxID=3122973 RepID=UPI002FFE5614